MQDKSKVSIIIFIGVFDDSSDLSPFFAVLGPDRFPSHVRLVMDVEAVLGGEVFELVGFLGHG